MTTRVDLKKQILRILKQFFSVQTIDPSSIEAGTIKRILVIRQHDMLGDFLLSTPVLRALRLKFPQARIGVIVREYFTDCISNNPDVDDILVFYKNNTRWNPRTIFLFWRKLRRQWDLAIVLNTVSHSVTSDLLAYFSGAKYILGSQYPPLAGSELPVFYNLVANYAEGLKHQTDRNLDIVRHIGVDTDNRAEQILLREHERSAAECELLNLGLDKERLCIGIHVGAGKIGNRWQTKSFAALAAKLHAECDTQIILFWGNDESQLEREFSDNIDFELIRVPPKGVRDLAARLTLCDALVCNDTGVMHICASVGVPLVAVFGPTNPDEWKPIGEKFVAVRGKNQNIENVSIDDVFAALISLLEMEKKEM